MHDVQKWHRVLPEHQELANATLSEADTPAVLQSEAHVHERLLGWEAGQDDDKA
jgi:hypothetical protein